MPCPVARAFGVPWIVERHWWLLGVWNGLIFSLPCAQRRELHSEVPPLRSAFHTGSRGSSCSGVPAASDSILDHWLG